MILVSLIRKCESCSCSDTCTAVRLYNPRTLTEHFYFMVGKIPRSVWKHGSDAMYSLNISLDILTNCLAETTFKKGITLIVITDRALLREYSLLKHPVMKTELPFHQCCVFINNQMSALTSFAYDTGR